MKLLFLKVKVFPKDWIIISSLLSLYLSPSSFMYYTWVDRFPLHLLCILLNNDGDVNVEFVKYCNILPWAAFKMIDVMSLLLTEI